MNNDLFKRFLNNTCSAEERERLTKWLTDPLHREEVLLFMDAEWADWSPSEQELDEAFKEADLPFSQLFREATAAEARTSGVVTKEADSTANTATKVVGMNVRGRLIKIITGVAASLFFLLGGAWIGYYYHGKAKQDQKEPLYYASAQTLRGQRSRLVLTDGSEIFLNADSKVSFPNEGNARQVVYLEGEAFFKVPDKEKPLIVKTKDLVASTKGSQFNISAFPKDSKVTVSVEKGRTEISSNNEKTFPLIALRFPARDSAAKKDTATVESKPKFMPMLAIRPVVVRANESVSFDKANKITTLPARLNEEELRSWKDGFIYFNHADSAALVDKLERWFDVEVSLDTDGAPLKTLNCGFRDATLSEVLSHIARDLNLEYRIEGRHVFLQARHQK
ncbi:FecR family protein [Flavitalea flava]